MSQTVRQLLEKRVSEAAGTPAEIMIPPDGKLGDYATNVAFIISKKEGKKPVEVAERLKSQLASELTAVCDIQVAANGFINFFLKPEFLQKQLAEIKSNDTYGTSKEGDNKTVIVEYSSPNIAKPMHIGHLRSTVIGDALANVYEALGYKVIRWNYIGDWGTQFGTLIAARKRKWFNEDELQKNPIQEMLKNYVRYNNEKNEIERKSGPENTLPNFSGPTGPSSFRDLENDEPEAKKIWKELSDKSLIEFSRIYKLLGINKFDLYKGESAYERELKPLIEDLKAKHIAKESDGALIVELDGLPPAMLRKSDGATLYLTRDLASLEDRIKNYQPLDRILYVVANQQALHFEQLIAVAIKLGWLRENIIRHVKFGMVLGEDGKKLATREGKVVALGEVINKITELARTTVREKDRDAKNIEEIAHVVGIGALKYNDLKQHPYSDITFDWKAMLDLSGNSGPYLQYTYARLKNIEIKAGESSGGDLRTLTEPSERKLMKQLLDFPDAILKCAELYTLNALALYLYELAASANAFYEQVHVLDDDNTTRRAARLVLISTVARTLKQGLALLGIETLERI